MNLVLKRDAEKNCSKENIRRVALSYPLSSHTPFPNGGQAVEITAVSRLDAGDNSNTSVVRFWNHCGTHMDGPAHMLSAMGAFSEYCPDTGLYFESPVILDVREKAQPLITVEDLPSVNGTLEDCDLLLIRTGFSKFRKLEPARYSRRNPGIDTTFAHYLVEHCPKLRCVGIDSISIAAAEHLEQGLEAHRTLFGLHPPVLLLEDLNLETDLDQLKRVVVVPWMIEGLDSCPCTVIAECYA